MKCVELLELNWKQKVVSEPLFKKYIWKELKLDCCTRSISRQHTAKKTSMSWCHYIVSIKVTSYVKALIINLHSYRPVYQISFSSDIYVIVIPWARVFCLTQGVYTHESIERRPEGKCIYITSARGIINMFRYQGLRRTLRTFTTTLQHCKLTSLAWITRAFLAMSDTWILKTQTHC